MRTGLDRLDLPGGLRARACAPARRLRGGLPGGVRAGHQAQPRFINTNIRNLAGVPAIVYGILGLAIFVRGCSEPVTGPEVGEGPEPARRRPDARRPGAADRDHHHAGGPAGGPEEHPRGRVRGGGHPVGSRSAATCSRTRRRASSPARCWRWRAPSVRRPRSSWSGAVDRLPSPPRGASSRLAPGRLHLAAHAGVRVRRRASGGVPTAGSGYHPRADRLHPLREPHGHPAEESI